MLVSPRTPFEASISSDKDMLEEELLLKPGTKNPLPGDGDKDDPIDLVLRLLLPWTGAELVLGAAAPSWEGSAVSAFFSSGLLSFLAGEGPHRNPFLILLF